MEAAREKGMDASRRAEAHRGSYLTDPAPLWCSCLSWLWKPHDTPTAAFKALTSEKSVAVCLFCFFVVFLHVLGLHMKSRQSHVASPLSASQRERIQHRFDFLIQISLLSALRWLVSLFTLFSTVTVFFFWVFFFLQTCSNIYKLGNTTEVLEERTVLASIHARSTLEYLLWNCDPSRGTAHDFPIYIFSWRL